MALTDDDREFMRSMVLQPEKRFFGFKLQELILFITFIFGAGLNFAAFLDLKDSTKYLLKFAKNSDNYHATSTGKQFEQGQPLAGGYDNYRLNHGRIDTPVDK